MSSVDDENYKWKVQSAAGTIIEYVQIQKQMKSDAKFKKAFQDELAKRLSEIQKAVTDTKEAVTIVPSPQIMCPKHQKQHDIVNAFLKEGHDKELIEALSGLPR